MFDVVAPQAVAVLATILNGSYMVPFKLRIVQRATGTGPPSQMVYQFYVMFGVLFSGDVTEQLQAGDFSIDLQGFTAAATFLVAMVTNFFALTDKPGNLGLALTQAICSAAVYDRSSAFGTAQIRRSLSASPGAGARVVEPRDDVLRELADAVVRDLGAGGGKHPGRPESVRPPR